jgi:hypothetical protein
MDTLTETKEPLMLDLENIDLDTMASLKGTALGGVIKELQEDDGMQEQAKHHSHSSYSTHGSRTW